MISAHWYRPATIERNGFKNKSLCNWSLNIAVGCTHGCVFCYVPSVSTNKMRPTLKDRGVNDPDAEWGEYAFLRKWDENAFIASLQRAEKTPMIDLPPDGNRAVMFCTTTDPYMVIKNENKELQRQLNEDRAHMVRRALELILTRSTLNVRILTRSALCRTDFALFKEFGNRLLLGMSIPTFDAKLTNVYEPGAPHPEARFTALKLAVEHGIPVYVAMAPTFPDMRPHMIQKTMERILTLNPVTIFHEPINIRAENVARIAAEAASQGIDLDLSPFETKDKWRRYAYSQLLSVESAAEQMGIPSSQLHLWPDGEMAHIAPMMWLKSHWDKISTWPK